MYVLKVDGMTCKGCVEAISTNIKQIDGGAEVGVDLLKKEVRVQSDKSVEEVKNSIESGGFDVLEVHQQ